MSQVNKYADRAAYASDTNRLSTLSAVSLIASGNELIYDGVNVVVGKDAAAAGDCAVYDKTAGAIRFVKGETLSAAQLPESLTPLAVVYARQGDRVLVVSLDNFLRPLLIRKGADLPLLLICVPIFVPIAKVFGWDLIWFGVIITVLDNMASITPPFGISLFVMKEVAGVTLGAMYRSAVPFVIALFVCLLLIVLVPSLATYRPTLMNG